MVYSGVQPGTYNRSYDSMGATTYTVPDLVAGQRYCFAVTAYTAARVEGPRSAEICGYTNVAPVLVNPGSQRDLIGESVTLQLQATDAQGQPLTFSATGLPPGLSLTASTGFIQGAPTTAGTYNVTARATDGVLSDTETFTWTVDAASGAPILVNPGSQRHQTGQAVALQLQASDPQGQALTFTATGLPGGLTITSSGRIQGTPTTVGTYQVTARVSDGSLSDSEVFSWVIDAANGAPVLVNPGAQRHQTGQAVALQLQATDPQGQAMTFTATGLPGGLTITSSGRIQGTPTTVGTYQVTARVSDGSLSDTEVFSWVIEAPNGAPVLTNPGAQRHAVSQALTLQLQASDPQGQALTFTATGLPPGLTLTGSTGRIQGTPTTAGTYQVTATVSDGSLSDSEAFTWTIDAANTAPVLTNPGAQRHPVNQALTLQLQASDPQGQALTFGATGLPPGLTLTGSTGRVQGTPTTAGTYSVTVTVSDGRLSDSEGFTWTIDTSANTAPVLTNPGAQRHPVSQALTLQLQASDPQGQALTFSATGLPPGLTLTASTGRIQGTPTTAGTYSVAATVSDFRLSDTETFTWTIEAVNTAPVLVNPGAQQHPLNQALSLQLQASDPQGQPLTFTASGLPAGLALNSSTGRIQGTPTTAGTSSVTVTVSDGRLTDVEGFTWTIQGATNTAPVLVNPGPQRHQRNQALTLQLQASDPQGQAMTFSATGLPPGLTLASSTGRIQGTPTTAGTYQVTATVSDFRLTDSETFTWTIEAPAANTAPVLVNPGRLEHRVGQPLTLQLQASDAQGDQLTFSVNRLPPGLTLNSSTGRIQGTPTTVETYQVNVTVSDGRLSAVEGFRWTIAP